MVGQGVLRVCILDPGVEKVLAITRSSLGLQPEKVAELVHKNVGRAMIAVARHGYPKHVFEIEDIARARPTKARRARGG